MSDSREIHFSQDYVVYKPKRQGAFPVQESDWQRLKGLVRNISDQSDIFGNLGSAMLGVFCSSALVWFSLPARPDPWVRPTLIAASLFALSLMMISFLVRRWQRAMVTTSVELVLSEMVWLEEKFDTEGANKETLIEDEPSRLNPGDVVRHDSLGIGKVISVDDNRQIEKVLVDFKARGKRRLVTKYANLRKID